MKKIDSNEEIERTLSSLNVVQKAQVDDDFEKILNQKISFLPDSKPINWLKYSVAAMILMAMMNAFVLMSVSPQEETSQMTSAELLAEDVLYQSVDYQELD